MSNGDLSTRFTGSKLMATAGDIAVVRGADPSSRAERDFLVAAGTGRELTELRGGGRIQNCASDGTSLIACVVRAGQTDHLMTIRVDDRTVRLSERALDATPVIDAVWQDRIFVHDDGTYFTLDRAGNRIDHDLPGPLLGMTGAHAVFRTKDTDEPEIHVHEIIEE